MEIRYIKSAAMVLNREFVNKGGLDLSKNVLWVSVGQGTADLRAIKVEGQKKNSADRPIAGKLGLNRADQKDFLLHPTLAARRSAAPWPTETNSTFLERSKPPLLTQFLFKTLSELLV